MKWIGRVVLLLLVIVMVVAITFAIGTPARAQPPEVWVDDDFTPGGVLRSVTAIGMSQFWQTTQRQQIYSSCKSNVSDTSYAPQSNPPGAGPFITEVAPDDPSIVASADLSSNIVWFSTDGGESWSSLGVPKESGGEEAVEINDIAVSLQSAGVHYIAVAGKEQGNRANIWYYKLAIMQTWQETNNYCGFAANQENSVASAVAFSPAFPADQVMVAVTGVMDNSNIIDYVFFEIFCGVGSQFSGWNQCETAFLNYPVTIVSDDGITGIHSSSILLDPGYIGSDEMLRIAYVCLNLMGDADAQELSGYYRLDDTKVSKMGKCPEPNPIDIIVGGTVAHENPVNVLVPWFGLVGLIALLTSVGLVVRRRKVR
jgi:hypothetical protein